MKKMRKIGFLPIILIVLGIIFLLQNFNLLPNAFSKLWPLILIAIGFVKIVEAYM